MLKKNPAKILTFVCKVILSENVIIYIYIWLHWYPTFLFERTQKQLVRYQGLITVPLGLSERCTFYIHTLVFFSSNFTLDSLTF